MKMGKLLSSKRMLTSRISLIDYHIGLLNADIEDFDDKFPTVKGKSEVEKAEFLVNLYKGNISNRLKKEEGRH